MLGGANRARRNVQKYVHSEPARTLLALMALRRFDGALVFFYIASSIGIQKGHGTENLEKRRLPMIARCRSAVWFWLALYFYRPRGFARIRHGIRPDADS